MLYCATYLGAWCSGQTCGPVKAEIAGSNPVAPAKEKAAQAAFFIFLKNCIFDPYTFRVRKGYLPFSSP